MRGDIICTPFGCSKQRACVGLFFFPNRHHFVDSTAQLEDLEDAEEVIDNFDMITDVVDVLYERVVCR